jgi:hypothetical protein
MPDSSPVQDSTSASGIGSMLGASSFAGLPLMVAGAGLQYAGAQDKSTAIRLAMRRYLDNLKAFGQRRTQRYSDLNAGVNGTSGQFAHNVAGLAQGVSDVAPVNAGEAISAGQQGDAVAATRAATAGMGSDYAATGNAANADLGRANDAHYAQRLTEQVNQSALGAGLDAGELAAGQAQGTYSDQDSALRQRIANLFETSQVGDAADALGQAQNESRGQSNMRFAQGVGNASMQAGQFAQIGGGIMGARQQAQLQAKKDAENKAKADQFQAILAQLLAQQQGGR